MRVRLDCLRVAISNPFDRASPRPAQHRPVGRVAGLLEQLTRPVVVTTGNVEKSEPERISAWMQSMVNRQPCRTKLIIAEPGVPAVYRPSDGPVDHCDTSWAAAGPGIVSCSPSAASADVCWGQPNRISLLRGGFPWEETCMR
jgi:hypothetical protein